MTNQKTIADISLLGGHPALDFVNTVDSRGERWGPEFLNTYRDLVTWARRLDLISEDERRHLLSQAGNTPGGAQTALTQAIELREALHRVFLSESEEAPVLDIDLALLTSISQQAQSHRRLRQEGNKIAWHGEAAEELGAVSERVAWMAADLLTSKEERRPARKCQGPNCGWLFLDTSRNGHRRWCSDKTCGSHSRVRRFRAVKAG